MEERKMIYLCLAHMSEDGMEQKYIKEAFDTNWVVPMGPNVNAFEKDLEKFVGSLSQPSPKGKGAPSNLPLKGETMNAIGVHSADPMIYGVLKEYAEENRKNPTEAECALWSLLKGNNIGYKFRRQHIIGDCIVDFFCCEKNLCIEIDGGYHNVPSQIKSDAERTKYLEELGCTELRFTNEEVIVNTEGVLQQIKEACDKLALGSSNSKSFPSGEDLGEAPKVVCLSAGTAAVHLALIACGVKAGDEVLVQSFTFCASSHPITYLGAKPVFVGSERDTWNMDPELLEKAIIDRKEKTGRYPKAIIPVALYGMPYDCERIMAIANKYGIPVIEDAAEGMGSRFDGKVLGTFGRFGVLSFNGNKMITTSGGGALICNGAPSLKSFPSGKDLGETAAADANEIMWYATQARDAYPYYEHTAIGYNYRMSNVCAGIGRGQMTVLDAHIAHHKHVQELYKELLKDVKGVTLHEQPADPRYDSNFWLCAATLDEDVHVVGQENAYKEVIKSAVGGAAGVIKAVESATTDCQPNDNVEALRVFMLSKKVECRPLWKPMHKQPVYTGAPSNLPLKGEAIKTDILTDGIIRQTSDKSVAYTKGVEEELFKVGFCLPAGPYVTDDDVRYIVECIKEAIA